MVIWYRRIITHNLLNTIPSCGVKSGLPDQHTSSYPSLVPRFDVAPRPAITPHGVQARPNDRERSCTAAAPEYDWLDRGNTHRASIRACLMIAIKFHQVRSAVAELISPSCRNSCSRRPSRS